MPEQGDLIPTIAPTKMLRSTKRTCPLFPPLRTLHTLTNQSSNPTKFQPNQQTHTLIPLPLPLKKSHQEKKEKKKRVFTHLPQARQAPHVHEIQSRKRSQAETFSKSPEMAGWRIKRRYATCRLFLHSVGWLNWTEKREDCSGSARQQSVFLGRFFGKGRGERLALF